MILLNNDTTNIVTCTLTENTTLTGTTYYLWEVISDDTFDTVYFIGDDVSTNEYRYNQFNITLTGGTANPTGGTINNLNYGMYNYNVYQQSSNTSLVPDSVSNIVERGRIKVIGDQVPTIEYYSGTSTTNIVYYNN